MEVSDKLSKLFSSKKRKSSTFQGASASELDRTLATSCRRYFSQKVEFHCVGSSDSHLNQLKASYKPLNGSSKFKMEEEGTSGSNEDSNKLQHADDIPKPKRDIYDIKNLSLEWKSSRTVGAGLCNLGNTCFLNSVLQCLLYTPPLYNYLASTNHQQKCKAQGFCALCMFQKHCNLVLKTNHTAVKPVSIVHSLKAIAKPFRQGRQEDAHEFLRYFVDSLQKSCLQGQPTNLDPHSKATTAIHKIFGGYHRSQVRCLECKKTSNTFDPLLDINLDIKNCPSLTKALQRSIQSDTLEGDNSYACPYCKKMTRAQKRFTVHRLPNVLTIQLKRFEYNGLFGGKINKQVNYTDHLNMRPFMSATKGPSEWYRLYAVLVHLGYSNQSGHYYCYIKNSNGTWYCMNDAQVSQVSLGTVLNQEAYLLFYIKDPNYKPPANAATPAHNLAKTTPSSHPPPRTNSNKTAKVKTAQNFSGSATASLKKPALDKMGTPLVKLPAKPTGIVNPDRKSVV